MKKHLIAACLLALLAFLIPIEHKYDKWFRFYSLTLIPEGLNILPQYEKKIYFYLSDCIALVLTAMSFPLRKWWKNPLWIVWLCALFSIIASPFTHYPIPYFRLLQLFTPIALVSFFANAKEDYTRIILHSLCFAALFQAVIAIAQYVHQGPLGLRLLGEPTTFSVLGAPDGSRWLLDLFFNHKTNSALLIRASGTLPHPNVLGGFLVFSILATYFLSQKRKIWLFTLPFQILALALSYSRSALFAWMLSSCLWIGLMGIRKMKKVAVISIASFALIGALLFQQYANRGGVINYTGWAKGADEVRKIQFQTGLRIVQEHPWLGVGFSQFSERAAPYFPKDASAHAKATAPHNIFLFLGCETGLISVGALLIFLFSLGLRFFKAPKTSESILFFSLLIAFLFIGCCDFYPILFQQGKLMFFLICGLLIANTRQSVVQKTAPYERTCLENV